MDNEQAKQQVRQFYDRIGWQEVREEQYQNASYEDLRPVSSGYIRRCHLRVNRYLPRAGKYLLDGGSGPIQYPEYLTYSKGHQFRVCVDISIVAVQEARKRIGEHGLFIVADVANLPFKPESFDGIVSLHTLHHLEITDQRKAYLEFLRTMKHGSTSVVINGWKESWLMKLAFPLVKLMERFIKGKNKPAVQPDHPIVNEPDTRIVEPGGTFVQKLSATSLKKMLAGYNLEIRCWRSVSVRFLRAVIHPFMLGSFLLWLLFHLENMFPHFFGVKGQYPIVILHKS